MKSIIFASFLLSLAGTAAAQQQTQQTDSTPPAQGWVQLTSGTTATFTFISLVGRDTVYVSGNDMLRSTDGGITWDSLTNVPSYQGVRMTSAKVQFVDDSTGFLCGSADTVYKTTNSGHTWHADSATGLAGGLAPIAMLFKSRNFGWLLGGNNSRTTDGGFSWQMSTAWGNNFNSMSFADTGNGFEMGDAEVWLPDVRRPHAAVFERTTDGGATWNLSYAGPSADGKHSGVTKNVRGLGAFSQDTLIAVGDYGLIAITLDGGVDWDTILSPTGEHLNGLCFPDREFGTAVGSNGIIIHTIDGGITWTLQNSGVTDGAYLYAVAFVDSLIGYAVGDEGIILKTINGGLSWVQLLPGIDSVQGSVYPNPANDHATISYPVPIAQHVSLAILDLSGATEETLLSNSLEQGWQTVEVDTSKLPSGTYMYSLNSENYHTSGKIEVIH
jgi:photosystem II stability/assembly factor-like uncharacterized protein